MRGWAPLPEHTWSVTRMPCAALLNPKTPGSSGELSPMAAMFGGFVGQEVVKALSGKFSPLCQWFYFDSAESMPEQLLPPEEYEAINSRWAQKRRHWWWCVPVANFASPHARTPCSVPSLPLSLAGCDNPSALAVVFFHIAPLLLPYAPGPLNPGILLSACLPRYDPQVAVFGRSLQRRLAGLKLFLVGAGALGCEFLKVKKTAWTVLGSAIPAPGDVARLSELLKPKKYQWHVPKNTNAMCHNTSCVCLYASPCVFGRIVPHHCPTEFCYDGHLMRGCWRCVRWRCDCY